MATITVEISAIDYKAFEFAANTPEDWVENAVSARVQVAKDKILAILQQHCNENEIAMAVGVDAQIQQAYDLGIVKTAAQVHEELSNPE